MPSSATYVTLKPTVVMRPDLGRAVLFKDFVRDSESGSLATVYLGSIESLFLALADRGMSRAQAVEYVVRILHVPYAIVDRDVNTMVETLGTDYLAFDDHAPGSSPTRRYDPRDYIFQTTPTLSTRTHLKTPAILIFSLTPVCGRKCIYCYAGANYTGASVLSVKSPVPWVELAQEALCFSRPPMAQS